MLHDCLDTARSFRSSYRGQLVGMWPVVFLQQNIAELHVKDVTALLEGHSVADGAKRQLDTDSNRHAVQNYDLPPPELVGEWTPFEEIAH